MSALLGLNPFSFPSPSSRLAVCIAAGSVAVGTFAFLRSLRVSPESDGPRIIPSPRDTLLPHLTHDELKALPYPLDALPGARDVEWPHGSTRVYEWGPEDGEKVLLIHGISTPCIALADLAHRLVQRGCRVMLYDLPSRGHSTGPHPSLTPYNAPFYTTQLLTILHASPLPWKSFSIIGYSLGGALAIDFTSYFPDSIKALVLIAPGGLIRKTHISWRSWVLYSGWLPGWLAEGMVGRRLWTAEEPTRCQSVATTTLSSLSSPQQHHHQPEPQGEVPDDETGGDVTTTTPYIPHLLLPQNPYSTTAAVVNHQITHHSNFLPAFISTIQNYPIHSHHPRWERVGRYISSAGCSTDGKEKKLSKVYLVLGSTDPIIDAREVEEDARKVLGGENVEVIILEGVGHEVGVERAGDVVRVLEVGLEGNRGEEG